jgi:hypothetical protein
MKSVGGADSQHRWQQVNKWLSTPTNHKVNTWLRTPHTERQQRLHNRRNRNGVTAFPVTCTQTAAQNPKRNAVSEIWEHWTKSTVT